MKGILRSRRLFLPHLVSDDTPDNGSAYDADRAATGQHGTGYCPGARTYCRVGVTRAHVAAGAEESQQHGSTDQARSVFHVDLQ